MPRLPGVGHSAAVAAFRRAGFRVIREGKHTIMSDGVHTVVLPRHRSINAITMASVVLEAGLTIEDFKELL